MKTVPVAIIEQAGALVAVALYLVVMQHIFSAQIQHKPAESWINRTWAWWLDDRLRREKRALRVWSSKAASVEPQPYSRED